MRVIARVLIRCSVRGIIRVEVRVIARVLIRCSVRGIIRVEVRVIARVLIRCRVRFEVRFIARVSSCRRRVIVPLLKRGYDHFSGLTLQHGCFPNPVTLTLTLTLILTLTLTVTRTITLTGLQSALDCSRLQHLSPNPTKP